MKEKISKVIYTDKNGYMWTEDNIRDLIDALASHKRLNKIFEYYSNRV